MSDDTLREGWIRFRDAVTKDAIGSKQVTDALFALYDCYRVLSDEERPVIDQLLAEQLESDDESIRFDALALIEEFRITSALPALRQLATRLETMGGPDAPFEREKVIRKIDQLTGA